MTTYRSDGHQVATGDPFTEVRIAAERRVDLREEVWSALSPRLRIATAVFAPGELEHADVRHESPART